MSEAVVFCVHGNPLPKQSFRVAGNGRGYTSPELKAWQLEVGYQAREAMLERERLDGYLEVWIIFWRKDLTRVDVDNLSKAVLDSMNGIVYRDDNQVIDLHIQKRVSRAHPGCRVRVLPAKEQNICEEP